MKRWFFCGIFNNKQDAEVFIKRLRKLSRIYEFNAFKVMQHDDYVEVETLLFDLDMKIWELREAFFAGMIYQREKMYNMSSSCA